MKKGMILLSWIFFIAVGFLLGHEWYNTKQETIVAKVSPAERQYNKELLLVRRNPDMKKGQFVYISGIHNEYLIVKKLEAENFPPPETSIFVVHSFHNHFYMYIKLISND